MHPEARLKAREGYIPLPQWDLATIPDMYSWMVNGQPSPVGLSVWISQVRDPEPGEPPSQRIMLPRVVADGHSTRLQGNRCTIRFLGIDLVYHPGWAIEHPLEADGRAVRMWPYSGSSSTVSIAGLPAVSSRAITWATGLKVHFAPGMYKKSELTSTHDWNGLDARAGCPSRVHHRLKSPSTKGADGPLEGGPPPADSGSKVSGDRPAAGSVTGVGLNRQPVGVL